jgi:hypothetical protein
MCFHTTDFTTTGTTEVNVLMLVSMMVRTLFLAQRKNRFFSGDRDFVNQSFLGKCLQRAV